MPPAESNPRAVLSLETVGEHGQNHAREQAQLHNLDYFRTVEGSMPWSLLVPVPFKGKISCIRIKTLSKAVISNINLKGGHQYLWLSVWLNLKLLGRRQGPEESFSFRHLTLK